MTATAAYERLVAKGCLCGSERPADCSLHGPSDNRGLAAFFKAGMPLAFPFSANCSLCGREGLMYPNVALDSGEDMTFRPTLVCPACSTRRSESAIRAEVEASGLHRLNAQRVFSACVEPKAAA